MPYSTKTLLFIVYLGYNRGQTKQRFKRKEYVFGFWMQASRMHCIILQFCISGTVQSYKLLVPVAAFFCKKKQQTLLNKKTTIALSLSFHRLQTS